MAQTALGVFKCAYVRLRDSVRAEIMRGRSGWLAGWLVTAAAHFLGLGQGSCERPPPPPSPTAWLLLWLCLNTEQRPLSALSPRKWLPLQKLAARRSSPMSRTNHSLKYCQIASTKPDIRELHFLITQLITQPFYHVSLIVFLHANSFDKKSPH